MIILIVIAHVLVSFFLIAVILLQAGRGQGLSWGVFGGTPQSILGTKTASFLSRVTTGCAIIFMVTCIALNIIETRKSRSLLAPQNRQPISQVDFAKIKEALEKAEKTAKTEGPEKPAASQPESTQAAAPAQPNQSDTSQPASAPPSKS
ncbi:MAG: preprotein translocase subunit SecG [Omnitrophica bacterium RIFCSPHIGHO2_02_FULL_46_11]|nr:MAG: preprotein translocase subunit SecG [Omnitrophica bacterium RIFCSPHIGHO2_02_FULL_46_11]